MLFTQKDSVIKWQLQKKLNFIVVSSSTTLSNANNVNHFFNFLNSFLNNEEKLKN